MAADFQKLIASLEARAKRQEEALRATQGLLEATRSLAAAAAKAK